MTRAQRIFLYPDAERGGRHYFRQIGTKQDMMLTDIELKEGMVLPFYCDDADDEGNPDDLIFEGTVHYDASKKQWYAILDEDSFRHESDLEDD